MSQELGIRIRAARGDAGLTREQLAYRVGVTLRTVARWEQGETQKVRRDKLKLIARATGKTLDYFYAEAA